MLRVRKLEAQRGEVTYPSYLSSTKARFGPGQPGPGAHTLGLLPESPGQPHGDLTATG